MRDSDTYLAILVEGREEGIKKGIEEGGVNEVRKLIVRFGAKALGGLGGVSLGAQVVGTLLGVGIALLGGFVIYGVLKAVVGIRLDQEAEFMGADLSIHKISATPEREST